MIGVSDRETEAAKATIVVVIQTPGNGSHESMGLAVREEVKDRK